jgi:hypothetical protein
VALTDTVRYQILDGIRLGRCAVDEASEAVGWIIRTLRFERWLDALAASVEDDVDRGDDASAVRVEGVRRPA